MLYAVTKIFYTIQGEGYFTGTPAIFIRLSGCNLTCPWCDTDFKVRERLSIDVLCNQVGVLLNRIRFPSSVIFVITGGEPTLQDYEYLVQMLHTHFPANITTMETNGRACSEKTMLELRNEGLLWVTSSPKIGEEDCLGYFEDPLWCGDELKIVLDQNRFAIQNFSRLPKKLYGRFKHFSQRDDNLAILI